MTKRGRSMHIKFRSFLLVFASLVGLTDVRRDMYKEPGELIPCENSHAVVSERGNSKMSVLHEIISSAL